MPIRYTGVDVLEAALDRIRVLYAEGHRLVVSFSAGKDSGVCLELCVQAARETGRLPVDVVMRDEEIMFPGTYEYAERVAARKDEINLRWIYACQPIINVYNRELPYWWVFDPDLSPDQWVRQPPPYAERVYDINIERMNTPERFPPAEGKKLFSVIGLRVEESNARFKGLFASKGYITKPNNIGVFYCRPIYDWKDGDVWKAHQMFKWDYNDAYDTMRRMGVSRRMLRIAPPTMNAAGAHILGVAARAWPQWFEKVAERCPGVRAGANFGEHAVKPVRKIDENWEMAYRRLCIEEAPKWISDRSRAALNIMMQRHAMHSSTPFPDIDPCLHCVLRLGCWKNMTMTFYNGDPFSVKNGGLMGYVEPEFFKAGSGTWGGKPSF